ncbi:hypothetical protein RvY_14930 [Ramazzottius varieornatus]|uniref:Uncharacterized protein n=1 Tax=Ramazzottius varieornatus TaxID=947166 RepID=A0A1D1VT27_RAMVA|nr:hypothetical protein RvY_14930 [Ramazzottius varieornatus]
MAVEIFQTVAIVLGVLVAYSECNSPTSYFPSELSNLGSKMSTDEVRSFIHAASFIQNSNVMAIEQKIPSLNVMTAIRNFQASKIGDYYKVLLRMWTKFGKDDRIANKEEIFKNIDSLKIPENFKSGFKAMFDHVDGLQKVILNAGANNHTAESSSAPTTAQGSTHVHTSAAPAAVSHQDSPAIKTSPTAEQATTRATSQEATTAPPPTNEPGNSPADLQAAIANIGHKNDQQAVVTPRVSI